jgi:hypothetical protein
MGLQEFKDKLSMELHGMTAGQAWEKRVCVSCKEPISEANVRNELEAKEFGISGLCGLCFDKYTAPQ